MGSPYYMAPEQMMSSKDVDARADIWALGIILYELLAGSPPFVAETMPEIVYMVTQRDPPPLAEKRPDVPPGLADVVVRCLFRDPAQRYANVAKLATALASFGPPRSEISIERISRVLGATEPPPPDVSAKAAQPMQLTSSTWASSQTGMRAPSRARIAVVVGASVISLGGAFVGWRALRSSSEPPRADRPPATAVAPSATSASVPSSSASAVLTPLPEAPTEPVPTATANAAANTAPAAAGHKTPLRPKVSSTTLAAGSPAPPPAQPAPAPAPQPAPNRGLNMGMKE